jgi:hypothetical protein
LSRNLNFAGHLLNREKLHASRTHPTLTLLKSQKTDVIETLQKIW